MVMIDVLEIGDGSCEISSGMPCMIEMILLDHNHRFTGRVHVRMVIG